MGRFLHCLLHLTNPTTLLTSSSTYDAIHRCIPSFLCNSHQHSFTNHYPARTAERVPSFATSTFIVSFVYTAYFSVHDDNLFIRDCNTNRFAQDELPIVDPLPEDLAAALLVHALIPTTVTTGNLNVGKQYHAFPVEFRFDSPQLPYPHSVYTSLECKYTIEEPGQYFIPMERAAICGDLLVVLYQVVERRVMGLVHTSDRLEERTYKELSSIT
ncbi:hypothetical protein AZE42_10578 [Rhizopogon vesiculosus]|uniref:Uncharacterized protein n=1 Tax=Rhizopogon vesiculosus TaxID=180088 RepID=A0A1J8PE19_9AGAM|nr:hypothetical protein AZE42_10578 [Rhizopogon vesiculosus]